MKIRTTPRELRWQLLALAAGSITTSLLMEKARTALEPGPNVGRWDSLESMERYSRAYDQALSVLPDPTARHDVRTSYGTVRVLEWRADSTGAPVVLLPGARSGAAMWTENLGSWIGSRTLYAFDSLGDAGFSSQSVPLAEFGDQAEWIAQTITGLGLTRVHTVGHSFGGANAAIHALEHPDSVLSLTLIEPVMVLERLPASTFVWATVAQLPLPRDVRLYGLAQVGGTTVKEIRKQSPLSELISIASKHYLNVYPMPRRLTDEEWKHLGVPLRVDVAGDMSLSGGESAVERMASLLPDSTCTLWPNTTHSLPMQEKEALGQQLEEFWTSHDA